MTVAQAIERKVRDALPVDHLRIENESHKHNVPPDSETHFKLVVVSESFQGQRPARRHQAVYGVLGEELNGPVHALALHLYTPKEWQARGSERPNSPSCRGGGQ